MVQAKQTSLEISEVKSIEISAYKNCHAKNSKAITLETIFGLLKTGKGFKSTIQQLRKSDDRTDIDALKKTLPAVTVSGFFASERKISQLTKHSGLIQIDIDKPNEKGKLKERLKADAFSLAVFDSPTLTGLKVIVKIDSNAHAQSFLSLQSYYRQHYQTEIDEKCKDVTRLMFLTWDENIFINYNSAVWITPVNEQQTFSNMLNWLQNKKEETFSDGNRNDFVYKLSAACFRVGVGKDFTLQKCVELYATDNFKREEISRTVLSGYNSLPSNGANKEKQETKPKKTIENFSLLARVEKYISTKYELRLNEVSLDVEFKLKGTKEPFTVLNENNIFRELQLQSIPISITKLSSLLASDFVSHYNPF